MDLKLFVIEGKENAGKTSTCWKILNLLKQNKKIFCFNFWEMYGDSKLINYDNTRHVFEAYGNACDFVTIVTLVNTHTKIGIISCGDEYYDLLKQLTFMMRYEVHHVICCCRTVNKGNSANWLLNNGWFENETKVSKSLPYKNPISAKNIEENKIAGEIYNEIVQL